MIRKLLVPLAATALLAGCVTTAPYGYRGGGQGDYYYGAPSVEYRYHGYPGYGYGDPYYGPYRPGFSVWGGYGDPYYGGRYGSPYYGGRYGTPYYGYPYGYPRPVYRPRPGTPTTTPPGPNQPTTGHRPDGGPWRNVDEIARRRRQLEGGGSMPTPTSPVVARPDPGFAPRPMPRGDGEGGVRRGRRSSEQDE